MLAPDFEKSGTLNYGRQYHRPMTTQNVLASLLKWIFKGVHYPVKYRDQWVCWAGNKETVLSRRMSAILCNQEEFLWMEKWFTLKACVDSEKFSMDKKFFFGKIFQVMFTLRNQFWTECGQPIRQDVVSQSESMFHNFLWSRFESCFLIGWCKLFRPWSWKFSTFSDGKFFQVGQTKIATPCAMSLLSMLQQENFSCPT